MDHIITTENFKQYSKNLKNHLKEMGFDISLGAAQNLLARTLGSKDYNTIVPELKKSHEIIDFIDNTYSSINSIQEKLQLLNEVNKNFINNDSENILNITYIQKQSQRLFELYSASIKFFNYDKAMQTNRTLLKDAKFSLFADLMHIIIEVFKYLSIQANETMDLSFILQIDENDIETKTKDSVFIPLSALIQRAIHIINLSIIDNNPVPEYQKNFVNIFKAITSYGIVYLEKEELSKIMQQIEKQGDKI
ncbi:hypothetical protein ACOL3H_07240 [Aliarcobacter butzleri]